MVVRNYSEGSIEEKYGLEQKEVSLTRIEAPSSGKFLEVFPSPGETSIKLSFPEFTCLCPKTSQPDFADILITYIPDKVCVELKSLKYYLNSFRNEGHFHEQVIRLIYMDLLEVLLPKKLGVRGYFNTRGGISPDISVGDVLK